MNVGDLYAETLAAASSAADLILVSPEVYTGFTKSTFSRNVIGFKFQIVGDEVLSLNSDITDHYVEDNTARQDHISLKPVRFTVSGYVGELNNVTPESLEELKEEVDRLGAVSGYLPEITNVARRAYNTALQLYSLNQKIVNSAKVAAGITLSTKQYDAFKELYQMWQNRTLFWVATPYGQFQNMAIESLTATQSENSKYISDFSISFKQVKFTKTSLNASVTDSRAIDTNFNKGDV